MWSGSGRSPHSTPALSARTKRTRRYHRTQPRLEMATSRLLHLHGMHLCHDHGGSVVMGTPELGAVAAA